MSETSAEANERRSHNRKLAIAYAKAGIAIHPVLNKAPLFKAYQKLDTGLNAVERAEMIEEFKQDHDGREPVHIGSTKNLTVIRETWKRFPDALPAICGGPNGLLMLDEDFDPVKGKDGPAKVAKWLADHGESIPEGCPTTLTQGGGKHVFFSDTTGLGNHEGQFSQLDTNVRGSAGYVVAPGSIREDGKTYRPQDGTPGLMSAFAAGVIPPVPEFIVEAIKTSVVRSQNVGDSDVAQVRQRLATATSPDFDELTDELDGAFDLKHIARKNPHFAAVVDYDEMEDDGSHDFSAARMTFANVLAHEYGDKLTPEALLALIEGTPGCGVLVDKAPGKLEKGEFNLRNVARDYLRAVGKEKEDAERADRLSRLLIVANPDDDYGYDKKPANDNDDDAPSGQRTGRSLITLDSDAADAWTAQEYFLDKTIPQAPVGVAWGAPNELKSFVLIDMLSHIVRGREWNGRRTEKVGAIYWFGEGQEGIAGRFKAWRIKHDPEGGHVGLADTDLNFYAMDKKVLRKTIKALLSDYLAATGVACRILVIDTWSKASVGVEENSSSEVAQVLRKAEIVAKALGITILFVAHTGKDATRGVRGASALEGNVDFRLKFEKRKMHVERMKDGKKPEPVAYGAEEVEIGRNKYDEPVTSLVITQKAGASSLSGAQLAVLDDDDDDPNLGAKEPSAVESEEADRKLWGERREELIDLLMTRKLPILHGKYAGWTRAAHAAEKLPWMTDLMAASKGNFARDLKHRITDGQPEHMTPRGLLRADATKTKYGTLFAFEPKTE